jgi:hypothetical protein
MEYFAKSIKSNIKISGGNCYFQTKEIINLIYNYLHSSKIKEGIISMNKYNERYNNNNDCFIHIRLGDVTKYNPGFEYYDKVISSLSYKSTIYISTDDKTHDIVCRLKEKYNSIILDFDEINTIQFGSTCKYVILSHGTFSSVIGYLSYFSEIYCPKVCYGGKGQWCGDLISIPNWNIIDDTKS